jgi:oxygen-independent coproporphyrinogen-3 oxidase
MSVAAERFTLRTLPLAVRLVLAVFLLSVGAGYCAGLVQLHFQHASPGKLLPGADDAVRAYHNSSGLSQLDLLGIGPSAISQLEDAFAQNEKTSTDWRRAVEHDLATTRGLALSPDDRLRGELLQQLYGHGEIDRRGLESQFGIAFDDYFAGELQRLRGLADDGLVSLEADWVRLTPVLGRLLVRVVAAVFDRYLPPEAYREGLPAHLASKVG